MRWLIINAYFPPEIGSASFLFFELGQRLEQKGHNVTVLTGFPRYNIDKDKLEQKYKQGIFLTEDIKGMKVLRSRLPEFPRYIPILRGMDHLVMAGIFLIRGLFIKKRNFDRILVYSPPLPLGLTAFVLSKIMGIPFIFNVQDLFPQSAIDLGVLQSKFLIRLMEKMESFIYKKADCVTVHSQGNKKHVLSKGVDKNRVVIVPNWIDTDAVEPGEKNNDFRKEFELGDKFIVSFAGVIGYSQDLDTVIEAASLIKEKDILFLIVGDGVETERLKQKVSDKELSNVRFLPMQPKDKYIKLLAASDACFVNLHKSVKTPVVPSKLLSIMAAQRPVVASLPLTGDAPLIIKESACGICVDAGDYKGLSHAIMKIYTDKPLREEYARNGRKYAKEKFSLDKCVLLYENLLT
ncbi:MAG: glycosyltransferase family 4 protein [Candidatus Omnitrophica bacterium]|nr:glycosyltransferase family 4 protein [Candidatus Omnitrophota bacterium]